VPFDFTCSGRWARVGTCIKRQIKKMGMRNLENVSAGRPVGQSTILHRPGGGLYSKKSAIRGTNDNKRGPLTCPAACVLLGSPDSLPHEHLTGCPLMSVLCTATMAWVADSLVANLGALSKKWCSARRVAGCRHARFQGGIIVPRIYILRLLHARAQNAIFHSGAPFINKFSLHATRGRLIY